MNILGIIGSFLTLCLVGSCVYFGPEIREHFGKRYRDADRAIFEESTPYVRGTVQHLDRLKLDYELAEDAHKSVLRRAILIEAGKIDQTKLPSNLRQFINQLETYNVR